MSADLLEANYERWLDDPTAVEPAWAAFFEGFTLGNAQLETLGREDSGAALPATDRGGDSIGDECRFRAADLPGEAGELGI